MKNVFAIIFFAAFIFLSAGCGNDSAQNTVEKKVEEVKKDAALEVQEVADEVSKKAGDIATDESNNPTSAQEISLGGISPGMTLDEVKNILGEPVSVHDRDEFTFSNGVIVEIDDHRNVAKEIKARQQGISAAKGISIGMTEQNLLDSYGTPAHKDFDDGATEYKYHSSDQRQKIVFKVFNGTISEIKCELDD